MSVYDVPITYNLVAYIHIYIYLCDLYVYWNYSWEYGSMAICSFETAE